MLQRVRRRLFPLTVTIAMAAGGTLYTTLAAQALGQRSWGLPYDLWGTLLATSRLAHGNIGGLYAAGTGLISLPGAAVILLPCAWVISAAGLSLRLPGAHNPRPSVWLVAGPYQILLCCLVLFAVDAVAERLGLSRWRRGFLTLISAVAVWSPSTLWGHPEDAVAVGLLLYAVLAQGNARTTLAGWLTGAAVCVQPLVLLALPVQLALLPWRRMPAFLVRSALPSAASLAVVAIANWHDTYLSITHQPNSPVINHPTIWTALAPHMSNTNVAAGPFRLATILLACCGALLIRRRLMKQDGGGPWPAALLTEVLWWVAVALALRSFFEPVMVSYYFWPPVAVALMATATLNRVRMWSAALVATGVIFGAQGTSHSAWIWWLPLVLGLTLLLAISRRYPGDERAAAAPAAARTPLPDNGWRNRLQRWSPGRQPVP